MSKRLFLGLLVFGLLSSSYAKTALDLMLEGRFAEARAILDTSNASPRYQLLYYALVEGDAMRACSLYQVVAIRYPETDCDSVARLRLDHAQTMGVVLVPIREWSQAPMGVKPLVLRRAEPVAMESPETPADTKPVVIDVPESSPPVSQDAQAVVPVPVSAIERQAISAVVPEPEPAGTIDVRDTVSASTTVTAEPVASVTNKIVIPPEPELKPVPTAPTAVEPSSERQAKPLPVEEKAMPVPAVVKTETVSPPPVTLVSPPSEAIPETESHAATDTVGENPKAVERAASVDPVYPETVKPVATNGRAASNGQWYIQVGAFANYDNAHKLALKLQNAGYPVKLVPRETSKGKLLQVRVGGYPTRAELDPIVVKLKEGYQVPTVCISE